MLRGSFCAVGESQADRTGRDRVRRTIQIDDSPCAEVNDLKDVQVAALKCVEKWFDRVGDGTAEF